MNSIMAREISRTIQTFNSLQLILVQFHNILIAFRFVLNYYTAAGCRLTFGRILLQLNCGVKDFATCKLGLEPLFSKFLVSEQVYVASKGYAWHHGIKVNDPSRYQRVCRKHALWSSPNLYLHQMIILALCFDKGQRLQDWPHGCPSQDQESTSFLSTQPPFPFNLCKAQCPWWLLKQSHSPAFCSVHDTLSSLLLPLPPMTSRQTVGYVYANTLNTKKTMGVKVTQYLSVYPSNYHADISSVSTASKNTEAPQT